MENVIDTQNLSKTYRAFFWGKSVHALDKLTLSIPKGIIFGFLGPNGAGKTTTIKLLMDLIRPTEGKARVFGKPVDNVDIKHKIGFLPDSPSFSSYLSAYEFLSTCAKLLKINGKERKNRIYEVLEMVRMREHAKEKLGGFSRGMIQRVGIAQALLNKPELLILDEPLVGLDPLGRQELKSIIFDQKKLNTNVFFCSHILSDVETICDHVGILHKGKLLRYGALDELLGDKGVRVVAKADARDLVKDLITKAANTKKRQDGGMELEFEGEEARDEIEKLKAEAKEGIEVSSTKESLESFFFKTIESESPSSS